ncbi:hypothetical protein CBS115989_1547 [Aspergillus niger]|uniref:Contig An09c0170, genomic contig n=3 Tax=Aspergillus niger TaxID=5061 RepID=A2QUI6_ASPNC|nr:uncharacterized protein An09g05770 [Aspergillus niger]RDH15776.1 DHH phosphoesterase [Aspergillus niger ATCC 13496]RDK38005.1 DHH phosphoesterase [Aspergillus phoenicis ATCC 13157]KAI2823169.1 hypothetical protein CBS115989_1547 [Aspergillus niger]KAI2846241.1 hypothetical protein CBS11350_3781 [Aspergillus niger]KAI2847179.1 hypothetical protein CBS11232_7213 [Aspergillus niger]|eukprot:XP_001393888.1 exopolyphosphatase [Aspergillus niger CBS 513.88]
MPPSEHSLFQFLAKALQTHHRFLAGRLSRAESPIYVIGNPSADLDSIISAIVYASFAHPRPHVPLINLATVPTGPELRRLRPEFIKSLWLSTHPPVPDEETWSDTPESAGPLLQEHILTVSDFATHLQDYNHNDNQLTADAVLVDWNALPIRSPNQLRGQGSLPALPNLTFTVLGCIDHHVDEHFLAPITDPDQPFLLQPAGSCTSLVVNMLDKMDRWRRTSSTTSSPSELSSELQLAKLAMSAILIDTANFTAKEKVTDSDTLAYSFLRSKINAISNRDGDGAGKPWDHNKFYEEVVAAKQGSLDLLTVPEVLERDYKEWSEKPSSSSFSQEVKIGICSMVRSLPWLERKAGGADKLLDAVVEYATREELDVVMVMTAFSGAEGNFCRELLVCAREEGVRGVEVFEEQAGVQLGLEKWTVLDGDEESKSSELGDVKWEKDDDQPWRKWIWVQEDVTKSRKQVAPLIREAVKSL